MEINDVRTIYIDVLNNVKKVMIGSDEVFSLIFSAALSGGHVLLEDNPGTGKTMMAKAFAKSVDADVRRVQFTPDLMPQDITGMNIYNQKENEFHFIKGPVFTNILLADEINRATPRTQSALLEAMEEKAVTVDGETYSLNAPFLVIATQNPIETAGTFPLPEAELDRFIIKVTMGEMSVDNEISLLDRFINDKPYEKLNAVINKETLSEAVETVCSVTVVSAVRRYIAELSAATRKSGNLFSGVSPRASIDLMKMAQSFAAVSGRKFVTPDDVRFIAPYVFAHRVITSSGVHNLKEERELIRKIVSSVNVPTEDFV